jgi:hypothetical protein
VAQATANLLDDYEEGSFTAEFSSSGATFTYSVRQGWYTKSRKYSYVIIFIFNLDGTPFTGTANAVTITGLPFTSTSLSTYASSSIAATRLVSFDSNFTSLEGRINPSTTSITLLENGGGQASNALRSDLLTHYQIRLDKYFYQWKLSEHMLNSNNNKGDKLWQ